MAGVYDVWRRGTTIRALRVFFSEKIRQSRTRGRDGVTPQMFEGNLTSELRSIRDDLRAREYKFSPYLLSLQSRGRGRAPREISIPVVRDRVTFRSLAVILNQVAPECSVELAQAKVRRVIEALRTGGYEYYLKADAKDFYPSISHEWLQSALMSRTGSRVLTEVLIEAVQTPTLASNASAKGTHNTRGIPQGLAVSNGLAELAVAHVDAAMNSTPGIAYFRYVDDVLILMDSDRVGEMRSKLADQFAKAGVVLHPDGADASSKASSGFIRGAEGFDFLGYHFEWPRVTVRRGSIERLESRIARVFTQYKYAVQRKPTSNLSLRRLEWRLNLAVTGFALDGKTFGWLAYFSQIRHHQLLEHLDYMVGKQMRRHGLTLGDISPKSFVDAYRYAASRRVDESGFVPNFDVVAASEAKGILSVQYGWKDRTLARLDDAELVEALKGKMRREARDLDRDITGKSG